MKNRSFNPLDIVRAQVSNKYAENCKNMKTGGMVILLIALIFITVFPYVNQRVASGLKNSDASKYPGLGAALIASAKANYGFCVKDGEFVAEKNDFTFTEGDWTIIFTSGESETCLYSKKELKDASVIVYGKKDLIIRCPETEREIKSGYGAVPDFSSEQIHKASKNTDTMVVYVEALLFSLCTSEIPSAIVMMIMLITVQVLLFIAAMALMLSYSKKHSYDKADSSEKYGFLSSLKIVTCVAIMPCFIVSGISYYKPSFGLSLGWIIYSFVLGLRVVLIYVGRLRAKDTRAVV